MDVVKSYRSDSHSGIHTFVSLRYCMNREVIRLSILFETKVSKTKMSICTIHTTIKSFGHSTIDQGMPIGESLVHILEVMPLYDHLFKQKLRSISSQLKDILFWSWSWDWKLVIGLPFVFWNDVWEQYRALTPLKIFLPRTSNWQDLATWPSELESMIK